MLFTADFETTTDENDCRVWAWAVKEIDNPNFFQYGNKIDTFIDFMENSNNSTFYFFNILIINTILIFCDLNYFLCSKFY